MPRFPNDPVLRRCAFNRCSILDIAADSKTTDAARDPSTRQRGHREGADKEGTLARAMKALWRELADRKIKVHHGPVVETTRLARSRAGKAGCRPVSRRSDQGQAVPALAPIFNRVTPGFWGQRPPTYCVADGQVMIEASRILADLKPPLLLKPAYTTSTHRTSTTSLPKMDDNHLMNIVAEVR